jgi:hypothetical protein
LHPCFPIKTATGHFKQECNSGNIGTDDQDRFIGGQRAGKKAPLIRGLLFRSAREPNCCFIAILENLYAILIYRRFPFL